MNKNLIILASCFVLASCTINLSDSSPPEKSSDEVLEDTCNNGNQDACEVITLIQKKKDEENHKIIKESGIRSK